jgi:hypothetical protein
MRTCSIRAASSPLHDGERRSEVMRHRAEKRIAEPLVLPFELCALGLLHESRSLDGEDDLRRERVEERT